MYCLRWNHTALNIKNLASQTAMECAKSNHHLSLVQEVEKLEAKRSEIGSILNDSDSLLSLGLQNPHSKDPLDKNRGSPSPSLTINDDLRSDSSLMSDCDLMLSFSASDSVAMMLSGSESVMLSPAPVSPASSVVSIASTSRSHDGVFLRPGAVTRSESHKYKTLSLDLQIPGSDAKNGGSSPGRNDGNKGINNKLIKRPSVDSGINMTLGNSSDSLPSLRYRNKMTTREKLSRLAVTLYYYGLILICVIIN